MFLLKVLGFLVTVVVIQTSLALPPSLQVLRRQLALMSRSDVANEQRRDCGFTKISAEECINRGCCWQPWLSPGPWCYQPLSDALNYHNGQYFSTKDRDNNGDTRDCGVMFKGAWWYGNCYNSNLNGVYGATDYTGPIWNSWKGPKPPLKISRMMIKAND